MHDLSSLVIVSVRTHVTITNQSLWVAFIGTFTLCKLFERYLLTVLSNVHSSPYMMRLQSNTTVYWSHDIGLLEAIKAMYRQHLRKQPTVWVVRTMARGINPHTNARTNIARFQNMSDLCIEEIANCDRMRRLR